MDTEPLIPAPPLSVIVQRIKCRPVRLQATLADIEPAAGLLLGCAPDAGATTAARAAQAATTDKARL